MLVIKKRVLRLSRLTTLTYLLFTGTAISVLAQPSGFPRMDITPVAGMVPSRSFPLDGKSKMTRLAKQSKLPASKPRPKSQLGAQASAHPNSGFPMNTPTVPEAAFNSPRAYNSLSQSDQDKLKQKLSTITSVH